MGFADRKNFSGRCTSNGADAQILEAPWRIRRRYVPMKIIATNESATASLVKIYDKSTTSGAPPTRGDNTTGPLIEFYVGANTTTILSEGDIPKEFFHAGMTVNATQTPLQINVEMKID